ncbi:MAG: DUF3341 domain-containing protein [Gemmatimonadetes bacterium]|nr:DUF3341 domain-containing protein [Gemmatimonadota bacterium]
MAEAMAAARQRAMARPSKPMGSGVLGHFDTLGSTLRTIGALREAGHKKLEVYSPIPSPEIEEALDIRSSPVRIWALVGGITGCLTGFLLTAGTSLAYPLVTQGKPLVSIPPYVVFMFELTVLLTGLFGFVALMVHSGRPVIKLDSTYRPEFSDDRWGIFVSTADADAMTRAESVLADSGAVETERCV